MLLIDSPSYQSDTHVNQLNYDRSWSQSQDRPLLSDMLPSRYPVNQPRIEQLLSKIRDW